MSKVIPHDNEEIDNIENNSDLVRVKSYSTTLQLTTLAASAVEQLLLWLYNVQVSNVSSCHLAENAPADGVISTLSWLFIGLKLISVKITTRCIFIN